MSPAADAIYRLRGALAGCAGMLVLAGALALHAADRSGAAERAQAARQRERVVAVRQVDALRADVERLEAFAARHAALLDAGTLGGFERTREVDRFERLVRAGGPGTVGRYTLRAPVPLATPAGGPARHAVTMQPLSFEATVPHEEAFLALWRRIADGLGGLSTIEGCELALSGTADTGPPAGGSPSSAGEASGRARDGLARPRLRAGCTLAWYAIEPRAEGAAAAPAPPPPVPGGRP